MTTNVAVRSNTELPRRALAVRSRRGKKGEIRATTGGWRAELRLILGEVEKAGILETAKRMRRVLELAENERPLRELQIRRIEYQCDMRCTRSFQEEKVCRQLKPGECILRLNRVETMLRLFDFRGFYTMYAPIGQVFNTDTIREWMAEGIGVELKGLEYDRRVQEAA